MQGPSLELPTLRQDLRLHPGPRNNDGTSDWLIYDPVRHRYLQIDQASCELLGVWKGIDSNAFIALAESHLQREVTISEIENLTGFLFANNLTDVALDNDARAYAHQVTGAKRSLLSKAIHNYLFFKIALVRPHRFLEDTLPLVEPFFTRTAFWLLTTITVLGLYLVSRQWGAFSTTFLDFLSLQGIMFYGMSLIFIKTLHELGHAYTATRLGVRVNTMGIAFMLMFPLLFTDVTDAWKLKSRRQKLAVAGAGMAVELAIAGVATFLWAFLPDGPMRSVAFVLATTSWIMSLAVNLNPFMRFDGYYLLADAWGIANLQTRAFAMARWWLRETLFDLRHTPPEAFSKRTRSWLIAYALGVWIYRLTLFLGIALLVYHMFFKVLGVFLFAFEIIWFICLPIWKELLEWWKMRSEIKKTRQSLITASLVFLFIALSIIPWSGTIRVPAIAVAEREFRIFAPRPAQITKILLKEGHNVAEGERLAVLTSSDLNFKIAQTHHNIELSKARLRRIAGDDADRSQRDVIENRLKANRRKLKGLLEEKDSMTLLSPFSGKVRDVMRGLRPGDWIDHTTPVARIVAPEKSEVRGYVHEADLWKIQVGQSARFIPEDPLISSKAGTVIDVAQAGNRKLDILYLSSVYGGDVPSDKDEKGVIRPRSGRYLVKIALDAEQMDRVVRGTLHLGGRPESFASAAWRRILQVLVRESGV